jgi:hypothetical protein
MDNGYDQANDIKAMAPMTMDNIKGALLFTTGEAPFAFLVAEATDDDVFVALAAPMNPLQSNPVSKNSSR